MNQLVEITDLDPAAVFAALYNNSLPPAFPKPSWIYTLTEPFFMSRDTAQDLLDPDSPEENEKGWDTSSIGDIMRGMPIYPKLSLGNLFMLGLVDYFVCTHYDYSNGIGTAKEAVDHLRSTGEVLIRHTKSLEELAEDVKIEAMRRLDQKDIEGAVASIVLEFAKHPMVPEESAYTLLVLLGGIDLENDPKSVIEVIDFFAVN